MHVDARNSKSLCRNKKEAVQIIFESVDSHSQENSSMMLKADNDDGITMISNN